MLFEVQRVQKWRRLAIASLLTASAMLSSSPRAHAQATSRPDSSEYLSAIERAVSSFEAARYVEAREHFARAHAIAPNARTLRGLGMVELELGRRVPAAQYLAKALASPVLPLEGALRESTAASLAGLRAQLAELHVAVVPREARVRLAGSVVDAREALLLEPGSYEVEADAPGFAPAKETVRLEAGDDRLLTLQLLAAAIPVAAAPASPAPLLSEAPLRRSAGAGPWIVVGSGAGMAVAGTVMLALAHRRQERVANAEPDSRWSAYAGDARSYPWLTGGGLALTSAGLVGVATGLIWYAVTRRGSDTRSSKRTHARLSASF